MLEIDSIWDSLLETFPYKAIVLKINNNIVFYKIYTSGALHYYLCKKDFLGVHK